jgi:hypothetical protein
VGRLAPAAFGEYVTLTGRFAAQSDKPLRPRPASPLGRALFRGFLFAALSIRQRRQDRGRPWVTRRWRALRLLLLVHGLGPPVDGVDLRLARRSGALTPDHPALSHVRHYLRSTIATLGTGRWPVVVELGVGMATLNAAWVFAGLHARGQAIDAEAFIRGLNQAADIQHADVGWVGAMIGALGGGLESLALFADRTTC